MIFPQGRSFPCRVLSLALAVFCLSSTVSLQAQTSTPLGEIIYDNSSGDAPDFFPSLMEYGDEITVKAPPAGQSWNMTDFYFEYYGDFTSAAGKKARLRLYRNDGPGRYASPGTLLFDSGEFNLEPGYQTRGFVGLALAIPNTITWTIQFSGLRNVKGDQAGLLLRPTPTVGRSFKDFWVKNPGGWTLSQIAPPNPNLPPDPVTNPDPIENFGARAIGMTSAPAPRLNISRRGDDIVVEWTGNARLQSSNAATTGFADVAGASSPHTVKHNSGAMKFWRLATGAVASAPPKPNITRNGDNIVIEWQGNARLQASDSATGGFSDIAGAVSPYTLKISGANSLKFWRLVN